MTVIPNEDELLDAFNEVMIANGLGPFWNEKYSTVEKWEFIKKVMTLSVSMVDALKEFKKLP